MTKKEMNELYNIQYEELKAMCGALTSETEYALSELGCGHSICAIKENALEGLFKLQEKITEIDCEHGLTDKDVKDGLKRHVELCELLLGTLENLEMSFDIKFR